MVRHVVRTDYSYLTSQGKKHMHAAIIAILLGLVFLIVPIYGIFIAAGLALFGVHQISRWSFYFKGASGERKVSKAIGRLNNSYFLFDDIVLYPHTGNIDHILLGPNGIFVIETKNYSGVIRCIGDSWYQAGSPDTGGRKIDSISLQAKRNASMLNEFLRSHIIGNFIGRLFVKPIIVFSNDSMTLIEKNPTVVSTSTGKLAKLVKKSDTGQYFSQWELERITQVIKEKRNHAN